MVEADGWCVPMSVALSRCVVPSVPSRPYLGGTKYLWSRLNWLMVSLKTSRPPPSQSHSSNARGAPVGARTPTRSLYSFSPCVLAPLMEGRFDAVTPVLRHVLQHPSQGQATLNLGTAHLSAVFCECPHSRCLYCRPRAISWCIGDSTSCVAYTVACYASLPCITMQYMHHCTDSPRQGVPGPQVCVLGSLMQIPSLFCPVLPRSRWLGRGCGTYSVHMWADDVDCRSSCKKDQHWLAHHSGSPTRPILSPDASSRAGEASRLPSGWPL